MPIPTPILLNRNGRVLT